ncbi:MAG: methyltransferase domain-containing protein [Acidobacteriota bacterium]|nr:methyltransferase domain-containing protein [Acidobacteriota bacterium]
MKTPIPLAHKSVHEKVAEILSGEKPGKLLDVPAGYGALALRMKELGFDSFACDLYPEIFRAEGIEIQQGNLNIRLPYDDASFDYVICVGGIEHVENPANAIREFSRILRSGGSLVISIPNVLNIEERLKWLFYGYTSHFKPRSKEAIEEVRKRYPGMEEIGLQISTLSYADMRYLLESNLFDVIGIFPDKPKRNSWLLLPFVWLVRLVSSFLSKEQRQARWTDQINSNNVLRGGNALLFHAKKK